MILRLVVLAGLAVVAGPAGAQDLLPPDGPGGELSTRAIQLIAMVTLLSLAPGLAIMITCFPFIVTVLSLLRQAVGLQSAPPNMVVVSLALFLTWFVMEPVFDAAWQDGGRAFSEGEISLTEAMPRAFAPFREFMAGRVDPDTLEAIQALRPEQVPEQVPGQTAEPAEPSLPVLMTSFMLSELKRAFEIGFLIYLPFLIIDLVVAAVLMSMGMMMVPPAVVSLPFKLIFFVVADGWALLSNALVSGYMTPS